MGDALRDRDRGEEERLPWLAAPRPRLPARRTAASRRSAVPIFTILALFLLASIGVVAFLVGRGSAPLTGSAAPAPRDTKRTTVSLPPAAMRAPPPAPVAEASVTERPSAAGRPAAKKAAPMPRSSATVRRAAPKPVRRIAPRAEAAAAAIAEAARRRAAQQPGPVLIRRASYPTVPPPGRPGRVIQLGVYTDHRFADAAWRRLVGVYPYLGKLPKAVVPARGMPGQPVYYRLQLGARTKSDARTLCRNLLKIGRGCTVVGAVRQNVRRGQNNPPLSGRGS